MAYRTLVTDTCAAEKLTTSNQVEDPAQHICLCLCSPLHVPGSGWLRIMWLLSRASNEWGRGGNRTRPSGRRLCRLLGSTAPAGLHRN